MGLLRLLLALCVVIVHSNSLPFLNLADGAAAVESFYVISGFYMALVLNTKYTDKSFAGYKEFLTQRILRLYPTYYLVLAWSLLVYGILSLLPTGVTNASNPLTVWGIYSNIPFGTKLYFFLTHLTIFGQEAMLFLHFTPAQSSPLAFTESYWLHSGTHPHEFMVIPPSWSIAVELVFYICAPFLVRISAKKQLPFILVPFVLRAYIYLALGWHHDPWTYRFFPTELAWFLIGSLSYRLYEKYKNILTEKAGIGRALQVALFFVIAFYGYAHPLHGIILPLLVAVCVPWLFALTKNNKTDRAIGELSYPVYLVHWSIIVAVRQVAPSLPPLIAECIIVVVTIFLSWLVYRYFESYCEAFRHALTARKAAVVTDLPPQ